MSGRREGQRSGAEAQQAHCGLVKRANIDRMIDKRTTQCMISSTGDTGETTDKVKEKVNMSAISR